MSGAFKDQRMSVDIKSMTTIEALRARKPNSYIAQFTAGFVRSIEKCVTQQIDRDPSNLAHAVVCPMLSGTEARKLANRSDIWEYPPPPDFTQG